MTPISYTVVAGVTKFRYSKLELYRWLEEGNLNGNVGALLLSINYTTLVKKYACYGTIENPLRKRIYLSLKHFSLLDGNLELPEEIIHPVKQIYNPADHSFILLDHSEYNTSI